MQLAKSRGALLGTTIARDGEGMWPVGISLSPSGDGFEVCGRGTSLQVYIFSSDHGYLVSVPTYNRSGYVPADCSAGDIMEYVDLGNEVDSATLAAAIRWIVKAGLAQGIPEVALG